MSALSVACARTLPIVARYRPLLTEVARQRLAVMRETNDGFEISRRGLELRGPSEMLETRQTGLMQMRVADLLRDADLLPRVQQAAELMLATNAANIVDAARRPCCVAGPVKANDSAGCNANR